MLYYSSIRPQDYEGLGALGFHFIYPIQSLIKKANSKSKDQAIVSSHTITTSYNNRNHINHEALSFNSNGRFIRRQWLICRLRRLFRGKCISYAHFFAHIICTHLSRHIICHVHIFVIGYQMSCTNSYPLTLALFHSYTLGQL